MLFTFYMKIAGIIGAIIVIGMIIAVVMLGMRSRSALPEQASQSAEVSHVQDTGNPPVVTGQSRDVRYRDYTEEVYASTANQKRILFFHAAWCPTCKIADQEFMNMQSAIPAGVVVLKIDYDTQSALKKKYGITYQHTFVQVDTEGNEIAKWNGGGITELTENIQ